MTITAHSAPLLFLMCVIIGLAGAAFYFGDRAYTRWQRRHRLGEPGSIDYRNKQSLRRYRENERGWKSLRN